MSTCIAIEIPAVVVRSIRHRFTFVLAVAILSRGPHEIWLQAAGALNIDRVSSNFVGETAAIAHRDRFSRIVMAGVVIVEGSVSTVHASRLKGNSDAATAKEAERADDCKKMHGLYKLLRVNGINS